MQWTWHEDYDRLDTYTYTYTYTYTLYLYLMH